MPDTTLTVSGHRQFWSAVDAGYAALRADADAWAAERADRMAWGGTLADGLDTSERWGDDRQPLPPDRSM